MLFCVHVFPGFFPAVARPDSNPMTAYQNHIEITPNKRGGKPCIKGTRITVYDILGALANGMSAAEILEDFPELTREDIQACLEYAAQREQHLRVVMA